ncbi:hypothetical protein [Halococcus sp. PRR34]|nr:hypothetical protein [Halococcus sp. PRR34]
MISVGLIVVVVVCVTNPLIMAGRGLVVALLSGIVGRRFDV